MLVEEFTPPPKGDEEPEEPMIDEDVDPESAEIENDFEDEYAEEESDDFYLEDAAAKFMQLEVEQVESAIESGLSLAEIARRAGVDVQAFTEAMVTQELAAIVRLEQAGEISAEESAEWQADAQQFTPFFINTVYRYPELVAAETIGIEVDSLFERIELNGGQTIAAIAEEQGVAAQDVVDAVVASETELIDAMVTAGLLDAEDAQAWKQDVAEEMTRLVMEPIDFDDEDSAEDG